MHPRDRHAPHPLAIATLADARWQKVLRRDPTAAAEFVYGVVTTGIFCRPSCSSRLPRPEHVRFFANPEEAEHAGFRACKRCRPGQLPPAVQHQKLIARACRLLETDRQNEPSLQQLATSAGLSPTHFHRLFHSITGTTPKRYAMAFRSQTVAQRLRTAASVTEAIYDAGYNASSRFYENGDSSLGMTPSVFRTGGKDITMHFAVAECTLGSILVAQSDRGLCAILLGNDPGALVCDLQDRFPRATLVGGDTSFERTIATVLSFLEHPRHGLSLPLDIRGTVFQQKVWEILRNVPAGTTVSYAEIAHRIGAPRAVRAVAGACAANPLAVAIPCHRVVGKDGSLTGYRWSVERKRELLLREGALPNADRPAQDG